MFGNVYHNDILRKYIIYFGTIFSDVWLQRDDANKNVVQTFKVPINYGPKEKFLARLEGNSDLDRPIAIQLPRMTFEMTYMNYDPTRKLMSTNRIRCTDADGNVVYTYAPVPYDIGFQLNIMVKNAEDGTRIVEQILPNFTPEFMATLNIQSDVASTVDVPITLNDVGQSDTYEGSFETRRALIWTLDFTMKALLFGPVRSGGNNIIKEINVNLSVPTVDVDQATANNTPPQETITIIPGLDANGSPVNWEGSPTANNRPDYYIDHNLVNSDDDYGFIIDYDGN